MTDPLTFKNPRASLFPLFRIVSVLVILPVVGIFLPEAATHAVHDPDRALWLLRAEVFPTSKTTFISASWFCRSSKSSSPASPAYLIPDTRQTSGTRNPATACL